jgi:hypothetical protein
MARLPTSEDLGARRIVQPRLVRSQDNSAEILNDQNQRTLSTVSQTVANYARQDDEFNYARARQNLVAADVGMRKQLADDPDWQTHEERYSETMKKAREDAASLIQGRRSRALFDVDAKTDIDRGLEQIHAQAKVKEGQWGRSTLDETLQTSRVAALEAKDPATRDGLVRGVMSALQGALDKQYITPEQMTNARQAWTASYGEGYVDVQRSPAEQLRLLRKPDGTPAQFIDPAKREEMAKRLDEHLQVQGDRREAKAERALAGYERQIAAGIPTTPDMLSTLKQTVAGTSVAGELTGMLASEKEVQDTLRKPIPEQIRYVQQKKEALLSGGGSMADAANVARLEGAVRKNVALIQNAPLLFGEQRLGDTNQPVDMAGVLSADQQPAIASTLNERAARLKAMQKQFGVAVPMLPLMPQEANQLGGLLDKASYGQASQLFANLRSASGSSEVFNGVMHQIAPDAPVKELAGRLAAARTELVTESNWFSPDDIVKSRDVSATLLRGDSILHPSKSDKAEDGATKAAKLYLPADAQADLQAKFANEVGNTFAGREDVADKAFQSVLAYYVGRQAEKGQVAADKTTVDSNDVNEAVRATIGNVVNFNGNKVAAPWGMAADDFDDRVARAWRQQGKQYNLPPQITPDNNAFGLLNTATDGVYAITLGGERNMPKDANDQPFLLDLRKAGADDHRGYIDRSGK